MSHIHAFEVQSGVDLVRLAESLAPMEPGNNLEREDMFIRKFSPTMCGLLDEPMVILGEGGIVALWYLPGALARPTQVGSDTPFTCVCL